MVEARRAMTKEQQGASFQAMCQDNFLFAAYNKGLGGAATVEARGAMMTEQRGASFQVVGQDAWLVAANNKGFVSAVTVDKWNALAGAA